MKTQLHPGAKWLFRIGTYFAMIFLTIFFGVFILFPIGAILIGFFQLSVTGTFILGVVFFITYLAAIIVIGEIYAQMAYNRWFYEFTNEELKIEKGIIWKRYSNIPYERIQNVDVRRGIIARMFGFSSLMIQTAGYSGQPYAEGYLPAVDMHSAEQIREFLMKKISKRR